MASDDVGLSPVSFHDYPEYKHHPNNTKTDQLPISEVTTGLPRPYHNTNAIVHSGHLFHWRFCVITFEKTKIGVWNGNNDCDRGVAILYVDSQPWSLFLGNVATFSAENLQNYPKLSEIVRYALIFSKQYVRFVFRILYWRLNRLVHFAQTRHWGSELRLVFRRGMLTPRLPRSVFVWRVARSGGQRGHQLMVTLPFLCGQI